MDKQDSKIKEQFGIELFNMVVGPACVGLIDELQGRMESAKTESEKINALLLFRETLKPLKILLNLMKTIKANGLPIELIFIDDQNTKTDILKLKQMDDNDFINSFLDHFKQNSYE
ncbi:MAG: hypothetical protein ACP5D9_18840 [Mariniphaga sp.]